MARLSVDDIRALLPDSEALRPFLDLLAAIAHPEAGKSWAGSGESGTLGERTVDPEVVERRLPGLADRVRDHLAEVYGEVLGAVRCLVEGRTGEAGAALLRAGELEREVGRSGAAVGLARAAAELADRSGDPPRILPVLIGAARIARFAGDWESAERWYGRAEEVAIAVNDWASAARASTGRGNLLVDRGRWQEALGRYERAERWVARHPGPLPEAWHLALNRCIVARREGRLADAERELALARERAQGEPSAAAVLDHAEGQLLSVRGRLGEAEVAFRFALDRATDPDTVATMSVNLADVVLRQGRTLEAGELVRQAEARALRDGVIRRLPELYALMGRVASARGNPEAFVLFERALDIARERNLPPFERAGVLEAYAAHELHRGDVEAAGALLASAAAIYTELGDLFRLEKVQERIRELRAAGGPEEETS